MSRLICFPWAGGGSMHYARWGNVLSSSVEGNTPGRWWESTAVHLTGPEVSAKHRRFSSDAEVPFLRSPCLPVFAVKLPGRESRATEPFFHCMQQIVDEVVGTLLPVLTEKPFALFGHRYNHMSNVRLSQSEA